MVDYRGLIHNITESSWDKLTFCFCTSDKDWFKDTSSEKIERRNQNVTYKNGKNFVFWTNEQIFVASKTATSIIMIRKPGLISYIMLSQLEPWLNQPSPGFYFKAI